MMSNTPLVSLILCVKNGLPYLPEALKSIENQTYKNIELVIQDGGSSDGTLDVLRNWKAIPRISLASFPDGGIGPGYNHALSRCSGKLVGSIDSDNLLEPVAVSSAVNFFKRFPNYAAVYGAQKMIHANGTFSHNFIPRRFELVSFLECDLVPPFGTSFFNIDRCEGAFYFDTHVSTCADFLLWMRLARFPIGQTDEIWGSTRMSKKSMTCNADSYDAFIKVKHDALRDFFRKEGTGWVNDALMARSIAGLYVWAAESVLSLGGPPEQVNRYLEQARKICPSSPRLVMAEKLYINSKASVREGKKRQRRFW